MMVEMTIVFLLIVFLAMGFVLAFTAGRMLGWEEGYAEGLKKDLCSEYKDLDDGK